MWLPSEDAGGDGVEPGVYQDPGEPEHIISSFLFCPGSWAFGCVTASDWAPWETSWFSLLRLHSGREVSALVWIGKTFCLCQKAERTPTSETCCVTSEAFPKGRSRAWWRKGYSLRLQDLQVGLWKAIHLIHLGMQLQHYKLIFIYPSYYKVTSFISG